MRWIAFVFALVSWLCLSSLPVHAGDQIELVETVPVETMLDDPQFRSAHVVWAEMIDGARSTLDLAQFYVSPKEEGEGRLEPILDAIGRAAARGVRVRLLADAKFARRYPEPLRELGAIDGVDVRKFDVGAVTGGVLHAKYFIVDRRDLYLGSQNFDWRSLEHIQELGVRARSESLGEDIAKIFDADWRRAGGEKIEAVPKHVGRDIPVALGEREVFAQVVATPNQLLPEGVGSELEVMTRALRGAKRRVRLQLLSYSVKGYDGESWTHIDTLLRDAAKRGVRVEILLADWSKKSPKVEAVQSLAEVENITIKFVTIPPWSGGHIPYARVVHAKYMVVDHAWAWVGSSNFSGDYFKKSRNVGLLMRGEAIVSSLSQWFERLWVSPYGERVDPQADYLPPTVR